MKRFLVLMAFAAMASGVHARDTALHLPIADALNVPDAQAKLDPGVKLFFGKQKTPKIAQSFGEDFTNKKTNAFGKHDEVACQWTMLSALLQLQEKARTLGADAVVEIESYYKKIPFVSETEYECHAGGLMAGVALKGRFVKLK